MLQRPGGRSWIIVDLTEAAGLGKQPPGYANDHPEEENYHRCAAKAAETHPATEHDVTLERMP